MSALREHQRARVVAELRALETREIEFVAQFEQAYGTEHPKTQRQRALLRHTQTKLLELEGVAAEVGS